MTTNQISLLNLREQQRTNKEREQETRRSNLARENLTFEELQEARRHNKEMEVVSAVREGSNIVSTIFGAVGNIGKALL